MNPLNVLGQVLQTLINFFPRLKIIPVWMSVILFVRGKNVKVYNGGETGLVWYWPLWTTYFQCATNRQVLDLNEEPVMTSDGKSCLVAGVITYNVADPYKYLVENYDADENIAEVASASLRAVVIQNEFEHIQDSEYRDDIEETLTEECADILKDFGVVVERVRITSFAPTRVICHSGITINAYNE